MYIGDGYITRVQLFPQVAQNRNNTHTYTNNNTPSKGPQK